MLGPARSPWRGCLTLLVPLALAACSSGGGGGGEGDGCVSNRDCASGSVCVAGACLGGDTTGCQIDADCPLGEVCNPESNKCGVVEVIACSADMDCPADQTCNTLTGVCIDAPRRCGEGASCPMGRYCDETQSTCVACLIDDHCPGEDVCEAGACVDPEKPTNPGGGCTEDTECNPPLTVCESGACTLGCAQPGGLLCADGEVCDTSNGRCVRIEGPCTADPDCTPPMTVCETGQCIPGCGQIGGVQCSGGQTCNVNTGRCAAGGDVCVTDDDCNAPSTICNLFSGVCEPGCGTTGCAMGETCNAGTGRCEGGQTCNPDRFEPNDSAGSPAQINVGPQSGLTVCPGDTDFFAISLAAGDSVDVTLSFVAGEGNLDLELLDPSGAVVATSAGTTGTEQISFQATASGVHIVHVSLTRDSGPTPGNTYTLDIQAQVAPCPNDRFEENDSDLAARLITPGNETNLNVCLGDEDFYDVFLQPGDTLTVDLAFSHAEGDIDAQILGFLGLPLAAGASVTDNESLSYTTTNGGLFSVRVVLATDAGNVPGNPYDMNITVSRAPPPSMCMPDALEDNDSAATASPLSPGNQSNLTVCPQDDDFYGLSLTAGDRLTVNVTFSDAEGDIDVELLNPSGTSVASASSSTDDETFAYTAAASGAHVLRVFLYADAGAQTGNPYALTTQVTGAATCTPDAFEPNDSAAAAAPIARGTYPTLTACGSDDDFYALNLTAGTQLSVQALFAHAEGDIDLDLLDPAGNSVASSVSVTDDENINYTPTMSGTFTLQVELYRDTGNTPGNSYQLVVGP